MWLFVQVCTPLWWLKFLYFMGLCLLTARLAVVLLKLLKVRHQPGTKTIKVKVEHFLKSSGSSGKVQLLLWRWVFCLPSLHCIFPSFTTTWRAGGKSFCCSLQQPPPTTQGIQIRFQVPNRRHHSGNAYSSYHLWAYEQEKLAWAKGNRTLC